MRVLRGRCNSARTTPYRFPQSCRLRPTGTRRVAAERETPAGSGRVPRCRRRVRVGRRHRFSLHPMAGSTGMAPPHERAVFSAVSIIAGPASGRAASWMSTTSIAPDSISGARWRRTFSSEPWRVSPPSTSSTATCGSSAARVRAARSRSPRRYTRTVREMFVERATASTDHDTMLRPASGRYALLPSAPTRVPIPAASTTPTAVASGVACIRPR